MFCHNYELFLLNLAFVKEENIFVILKYTYKIRIICILKMTQYKK